VSLYVEEEVLAVDWRILYNPLVVLGKRKGFAASILVTVVLVVLAQWGWVYFDGALDVHLNGQPALGGTIVRAFVSWFSLAGFFFLTSKWFRGNGGFRAHLAASGMGKIPYILSAIVGAHQLATGTAIRAMATVVNGTVTINLDQAVSPAATMGIVLLLIYTVWSVAMLYSQFKTASTLSGARAAMAFVVGILLAEFTSVAVLVVLRRLGMGG
jgi:hypothetical protein